MDSTKVTSLDLAELRRVSAARAQRWGTDERWTVTDRSNEMSGEWGEACNVIKKLRRAALGLPGNKKSVEELQRDLFLELGDTMICLDLVAASLGVDLAAATRAAFNGKSEQLGFPERI